jgi:hypothetical protein
MFVWILEQRGYFCLTQHYQSGFYDGGGECYCAYALSPYIKQSLLVFRFISQLNINLLIKQNLHSTYTVHLCVLYGSVNKERLLPYTALTDCYL